MNDNTQGDDNLLDAIPFDKMAFNAHKHMVKIDFFYVEVWGRRVLGVCFFYYISQQAV